MESAKMLGMWAEYCGEDFPSIAVAHKGNIDNEIRERIAAYLENSPIWVASPGVAHSLLNGNEIAGTTSIRTDGTWAWHDTFAHYVRNHAIVPPDDFLKWVEAHKYTAPAEDEIDLISLEFPMF